MKVEIGPYQEWDAENQKYDIPERKIVVKLDSFDSWNADQTIAIIVHPLLVQLKATKHGAPNTEDEDVPERLKSTSAPPKENEWDVDSNWFARWDWIMEEMIFAMSQIANGDYTSEFYNNSNAKDFDKCESVSEWIGGIKVDREGMEAKEKRVANGCRLFGKYLQSLWD